MMVFSGGISALVFPTITRQSPEVTDFTLPLSHPETAVPVAMADSCNLHHQKNYKKLDFVNFFVDVLYKISSFKFYNMVPSPRNFDIQNRKDTTLQAFTVL